jgi:WD40 repeat protein
MICALRIVGDQVLSGGKDGKIVVCDMSGAATQTVQLDGLVRSVDLLGSTILAGMRSGHIYKIDGGSPVCVMESHNEGEVWGLAVGSDGVLVSSGDDNQVKSWDYTARVPLKSAIISSESEKAPKGGASSLSDLPDSKCARATAVNVNGNGHVAVCHNNGWVTIRESQSSLDNVTHTLKDAQEWSECAEYSPCGNFLAVGSHDNKTYIYDSSDYSLKATCKAHSSYICGLDWSEDSTYLRTVCGAYELLFFTVADGEQDKSGASNTKDTAWVSQSCKFGWHVTNVFPKGTDGTHINHMATSTDKKFLATADDWGLVCVYNYPCRSGAKPVSFRAHSEHVTKVRWSQDDQYLFSAGGYDQTVLVWKKC